MLDLFKYAVWYRIRVVPILNYDRYNEEEVQSILENELEWEYYGGHHQESHYTKFIQTYLLPKKFNIDKRKTEFSALIRSGQKERDQAIREIEENPYTLPEDQVEYVLAKLGLTADEWKELYELPPRRFTDYPTLYPLMKKSKPAIRLLVNMGVLPELLYLKYLY